MVRLPNDAGLVAIKTETADPSRAVKKKPQATKIVAVFFKNDGSTPMTPPPTEVVFELESLRSKTADLKPVTLEADPTTPNRFVSAASSFPGGVAGKLRVKIDGQDLEESFSLRGRGGWTAACFSWIAINCTWCPIPSSRLRSG